MALQSNFFGSKREADSPLSRTTPPAGAASVTMPSSSSSSSNGASASAGSPASTGGSTTFTRDSAPVPVVSDTPVLADNPSKLTVGPNIKLKGVEITDCDTLVVEGLVEATMDSRVMQVEQEGAFKGSAQVDFAEIRGKFDGTLNARTRLVIRSTGKVTGTVRYGSIVIEEGGQLGGEVHFGPATGGSSASSSAASSSSSAPRLERAVA